MPMITFISDNEGNIAVGRSRARGTKTTICYISTINTFRAAALVARTFTAALIIKLGWCYGGV